VLDEMLEARHERSLVDVKVLLLRGNKKKVSHSMPT
jgi:hypothetical protein